MLSPRCHVSLPDVDVECRGATSSPTIEITLVCDMIGWAAARDLVIEVRLLSAEVHVHECPLLESGHLVLVTVLVGVEVLATLCPICVWENTDHEHNDPITHLEICGRAPPACAEVMIILIAAITKQLGVWCFSFIA